jgi:cytochrome b561
VANGGTLTGIAGRPWSGVGIVDQDTFETVTRTAAGDFGEDYDNVAIGLHWVTALLIVIQVAFGQTWGWFPRSAGHPMVLGHISFGIMLAMALIARVLCRFAFRHRVSSLETGLARIVSTTVHYLFYGLLGAEAVLGFLSRWEGNEAMSSLGLQISSFLPGAGRRSHTSCTGLAHALAAGITLSSTSWHGALALNAEALPPSLGVSPKLAEFVWRAQPSGDPHAAPAT